MEKKNKLCPICKKAIDSFPALSRRDNKTHICTKCGQREAIEDYEKYQERMIAGSTFLFPVRKGREKKEISESKKFKTLKRRIKVDLDQTIDRSLLDKQLQYTFWIGYVLAMSEHKLLSGDELTLLYNLIMNFTRKYIWRDEWK